MTNEKETLVIKRTFSPDMDGFRIQKRFFCKELGLLKVGEDTASSLFFDIGVGGVTSMKKIQDVVNI